MLNCLCKEYTNLSIDDINKLIEIEQVLPLVANLVQADVFIDCMVKDLSAAIVVAQAKPTSSKSMYKDNVVGKMAFRKNEPAVLRTLEIGLETRDLKAITQENIMVKQNVIPIMNDSNDIIAVLIMEQDVTEDFERNKYLGILSEATEQLTQTLMDFKEPEKYNPITNHLNDAILIFDIYGNALYVNAAAEELYKKLGYKDKIQGMHFDNLALDGTSFNRIRALENYHISEVNVGELWLQVKYALTKKSQNTICFVMLIKDMTDIKAKEKEIILKSVAMREIHHRVKNNLQTIASILSLQSRRVKDEEAKKYFNESINRIVSIAATHEILAQNGVDDVDIKTIISKVIENTLIYGLSPNKDIKAIVKGDSFFIDSDTATSVAMITNELLQNSIEHAFENRNEGSIEIVIQRGIMYSNVSVIDNGEGFNIDTIKKDSLGLSIVSSIVKDKLNGDFKIKSNAKGTKVIFSFNNNNKI